MIYNSSLLTLWDLSTQDTVLELQKVILISLTKPLSVPSSSLYEVIYFIPLSFNNLLFYLIHRISLSYFDWYCINVDTQIKSIVRPTYHQNVISPLSVSVDKDNNGNSCVPFPFIRWRRTIFTPFTPLEIESLLLCPLGIQSQLLDVHIPFISF